MAVGRSGASTSREGAAAPSASSSSSHAPRARSERARDLDPVRSVLGERRQVQVQVLGSEPGEREHRLLGRHGAGGDRERRVRRLERERERHRRRRRAGHRHRPGRARGGQGRLDAREREQGRRGGHGHEPHGEVRRADAHEVVRRLARRPLDPAARGEDGGGDRPEGQRLARRERERGDGAVAGRHELDGAHDGLRASGRLRGCGQRRADREHAGALGGQVAHDLDGVHAGDQRRQDGLGDERGRGAVGQRGQVEHDGPPDAQRRAQVVLLLRVREIGGERDRGPAAGRARGARPNPAREQRRDRLEQLLVLGRAGGAGLAEQLGARAPPGRAGRPRPARRARRFPPRPRAPPRRRAPRAAAGAP